MPIEPYESPSMAADLEELIESIPEFDTVTLVEASADMLVSWLVKHEDRVPRNLFDACVARGDAMVAALRDRHLQSVPILELEGGSGEWWLLFHAVQILGAIPGDAAGDLLLALWHAIEESEDEDLNDWLASAWPYAFVNKPAGVIAKLRDIVHDQGVDWSVRSHAANALKAVAEAAGGGAIEPVLDELLAIATDKTDDDMLRFLVGAQLLDFPRDRHRKAFLALADEQKTATEFIFDRGDVERAFKRGTDDPEWLALPHPLGFYDDDAILLRQQRWAREALEVLGERDEFREFGDDQQDDWAPVEQPYVRETPKVGRNDPCPCGSGKKYKKCCL